MSNIGDRSSSLGAGAISHVLREIENPDSKAQDKIARIDQLATSQLSGSIVFTSPEEGEAIQEDLQAISKVYANLKYPIGSDRGVFLKDPARLNLENCIKEMRGAIDSMKLEKDLGAELHGLVSKMLGPNMGQVTYLASKSSQEDPRYRILRGKGEVIGVSPNRIIEMMPFSDSWTDSAKKLAVKGALKTAKQSIVIPQMICMQIEKEGPNTKIKFVSQGVAANSDGTISSYESFSLRNTVKISGLPGQEEFGVYEIEFNSDRKVVKVSLRGEGSDELITSSKSLIEAGAFWERVWDRRPTSS
jgi:hypothetical protein